MSLFQLDSKFKPSGDQPEAIQALLEGFRRGDKWQTLLGVTGSGKTFTLANVIAALDRPVLLLSHNKTLAAQLYSEFKSFFPNNAVEYFISYYDYYLPESYIPQTDTYIAKDASINEEIEKLRLSATASLLEVPVLHCISNNTYLGHVKQMQNMFYDKRYASTCLRYSRSCKRSCQTEGICRGEQYVPDFVKLAESYNAEGIRVTNEEEMKEAFRRAKSNTNRPTVIEFIIDCDYDVYPMVPGGKALTDMMFG